jgi:hypothetical protein
VAHFCPYRHLAEKKSTTISVSCALAQTHASKFLSRFLTVERGRDQPPQFTIKAELDDELGQLHAEYFR